MASSLASFALCFIAVCSVRLAASRPVFYQNICDDSRCTEGCQASALPQGECVLTTNGGSALNYCSEYGYLLQKVYMFTPNCTLYEYSQEAELNTCLNGDTLYVEYDCPSSSRQRELTLRKPADAVAMKTATLSPLEGLRWFNQKHSEDHLFQQHVAHVSSFAPLSLFKSAAEKHRGELRVVVSASTLRVSRLRSSFIAPLSVHAQCLFHLNGEFLAGAELPSAAVAYSAREESVELAVDVGAIRNVQKTLRISKKPTHVTIVDLRDRSEIITLCLVD